MRACFPFLFAIMLSLNTAYAASVGVCDALEHSPSHAAHFGHHSDEHSDDHVHDEPAVDADGASNVPAVDHHHTHVHPDFSSILSNAIGVMPLIGRSHIVAIPASTFVSTPQALLDRPPKVTLA